MQGSTTERKQSGENMRRHLLPLLRFIEEHGDFFKGGGARQAIVPPWSSHAGASGKGLVGGCISFQAFLRRVHGSSGERLSMPESLVSDIELFKWARLNGHYFEMHKRGTHTAMCCAAARSGHPETLQHIASFGNRMTDSEEGLETTAAALEGG